MFSSPVCKFHTAPQPRAAPSAAAAPRRPLQHNSRQRMLLNLASTGPEASQRASRCFVALPCKCRLRKFQNGRRRRRLHSRYGGQVAPASTAPNASRLLRARQGKIRLRRLPGQRHLRAQQAEVSMQRLRGRRHLRAQQAKS